MNPVAQLVRAPVAAVEFANLLLTRDDAQIGITPKDVVWTHRKTTLYRYRSTRRTHALPILLVFARSRPNADTAAAQSRARKQTPRRRQPIPAP